MHRYEHTTLPLAWSANEPRRTRSLSEVVILARKKLLHLNDLSTK